VLNAHERNPSVSYNCMMARGWESKSVEAQIEESFSEPSRGEASSSSAEELQSEMKRAELMLSRKHVLQQLERSASERYSELLRRTLADLDAQIAAVPLKTHEFSRARQAARQRSLNR